jgi:hypothetical protein
MMKTIGRILIILAVFSIVAGLMVTIVNASGANAPDFGRTQRFRPEGGNDGANRQERGNEGPGGPRWMFGLVKNVGVMALLVILIVWPKSIAKKIRKQTVVNSTLDQP